MQLETDRTVKKPASTDAYGRRYRVSPPPPPPLSLSLSLSLDLVEVKNDIPGALLSEPLEAHTMRERERERKPVFTPCVRSRVALSPHIRYIRTFGSMRTLRTLKRGHYSHRAPYKIPQRSAGMYPSRDVTLISACSLRAWHTFALSESVYCTWQGKLWVVAVFAVFPQVTQIVQSVLHPLAL